MKITTDFDTRFVRPASPRITGIGPDEDGHPAFIVQIQPPLIECDAVDAPKLVAELRRVADEVEAELAGSLSWARKG